MYKKEVLHITFHLREMLSFAVGRFLWDVCMWYFWNVRSHCNITIYDPEARLSDVVPCNASSRMCYLAKNNWVQWCSLTFWALSQSGKWNRTFWDFWLSARKSTHPTIFHKIQFAIVLSHFLMLRVFYAYTEECKHNDYF